MHFSHNLTFFIYFNLVAEWRNRKGESSGQRFCRGSHGRSCITTFWCDFEIIIPLHFFSFFNLCCYLSVVCVRVCFQFFFFYSELVGFWIFCGTFLCYNTCFYGLLLFKGYLNSQLAEIYITSTVSSAMRGIGTLILSKIEARVCSF